MGVQKAMEAISSTIQQMIEADRQKVGGLTLGASARLGMEELRQAVALDGSVSGRTQTPLGMYASPTPGEVSAARQEATVHGPEVEKEGVEKQIGPSNDPVATAQRQAAASQDASRDRGGNDMNR